MGIALGSTVTVWFVFTPKPKVHVIGATVEGPAGPPLRVGSVSPQVVMVYVGLSRGCQPVSWGWACAWWLNKMACN